jgi:hypothetical protein
MEESIKDYDSDPQPTTVEDLVEMYEQRLHDQTAIIFGLLSKMGGEAKLTALDFDSDSAYNTVTATNNIDGDVVLKITHEEVTE